MNEIIAGFLFFAGLYAFTGCMGWTLFGSKLLFATLIGGVFGVILIIYCLWHLTYNVKMVVYELRDIEQRLIHRK